MYVEALGPDRCRGDRCAPCSYYHLKKRALAGESLTEAEREFVGFTQPHRSAAWRPAGWIAAAYDGLDVEGRELLQVLREPPTAAQVDFL